MSRAQNLKIVKTPKTSKMTKTGVPKNDPQNHPKTSKTIDSDGSVSGGFTDFDRFGGS